MLRPSLARPSSSLPALLLCAACAAPADGGAPTAESVAPDLGGSVLVVHSAGLDALFPDPRDAGLRRALALLDERLLELPEELGGSAPPPGTLEFLCEALAAPWTLRVGLDGEGPVPVRATLVVRLASAERAAALEARLAGLVELFGLPHMRADERPGLTEVETPGGSVFFGTQAEGSALLVAFGAPDDRPWEGAGGLPDGVRANCAVGLDVGRLVETVRRTLPEDDAEADELRRMLDFVGLDGAVPVTITVTAGQGRERAHSVMRYGGWAELARASGALADGPLPPEAFALVPADATLVSLSRGEPTALARYLEALGEAVAEPRAELEQALGIALDAELLTPLGATFGLYLSDATGGGGLASAVFFVAVDDEVVLAHTLETLAAQLHQFALARADGRLRVHPLELEGALGYGLDFPGLPVPLSPAVALAQGHLFVAATPQALGPALDQARTGQKGKGGWRAEVAGARLGSLEDLQSLLYFDAPRYARAGYGAGSLLAAGVANALRSPTDPARDPGLLWPSHAELFAAAEPLVSLGRLEGSDLVTRTGNDRSAALHLAAVLGCLPELLPGVLLLGSLGTLAVPEVVESLEAANRAKAEADILMLVSALDGYAVENDGLYPAALEDLLEPSGSDGLAWLEELEQDPWGNPYVYFLDEADVHVLSYGADGVRGGEGEARDITSDELQEGWVEEEDGPEEEDDG